MKFLSILRTIFIIHNLELKFLLKHKKKFKVQVKSNLIKSKHHQKITYLYGRDSTL